jgi:hypothetical protein
VFAGLIARQIVVMRHAVALVAHDGLIAMAELALVGGVGGENAVVGSSTIMGWASCSRRISKACTAGRDGRAGMKGIGVVGMASPVQPMLPQHCQSVMAANINHRQKRYCQPRTARVANLFPESNQTLANKKCARSNLARLLLLIAANAPL